MNTETETSPKDRMLQWAAKHGVTMTAEFVPFSQSRNKGDKSPSLNWRVTLHKTCGAIHAGMASSSERLDIPAETRDILTTDYSAGCGHCPSYTAAYSAHNYADNHEVRARVNLECETGKSRKGRPIGAPILPDLDAVLWSFAMDYGALDAGGFESWAVDNGYDTDSRAAEKTYQTCLDLALKLRAALGDAAMAELVEAGRDY